jgi:hypothetical protein
MADPLEMKAIGFANFGGLRLDQALDQVGPEASIFEHDIERDGSLGNFRSRDGFQKLNASAATGEYKGLWPHSSIRLLAVKRVKSTEAKIVALDKEGTEKVTATWPETEAPSTFASIGTPAASYTFMRSFTTAAKVIRFDGTTFTEPTATMRNTNTETGEKEAEITGKAMPLARHLVAWPDAANVLVFANTSGATGGPNGESSSNSHVWFSYPGEPEKFEKSAFLRFGVGDGEEITGICVYGAQLYVFKESKFWVVSPPNTNTNGQPVFSFREVTLGSGSRIRQVLTEKLKETSDRICWASQDGVFFTTTDGIYVTTGGAPQKISGQLKPLEETVPFEGPMYEFLNGSTESFRWPAVGICAVGRKLFVKRYEFMFVYDIPIETWTCWKMPSVSMAVWTGLTGGGAEVSTKNPTKCETASTGTAWSNPENFKEIDASYATAILEGGTLSQNLVGKKLGFAIPVGATIVGISASIQRKSEKVSLGSAGIRESVVSIMKAGVLGENKAKAGEPGKWSEIETLVTYGGQEELWGTTWTPAQINEEGFGFAVKVENWGSTKYQAFANGLVVTVYYLTAESSSGTRPRLFASQSKTVFWTGPSAVEEATFPGWAWQCGLYDLGSEDEKELVMAKLWGSNQTAKPIKVATSYDFKAIEERQSFEMGEATTQYEENISDKATLFSHRLSGEGKAFVQRFVRYLRTTATSGSQSNPS